MLRRIRRIAEVLVLALLVGACPACTSRNGGSSGDLVVRTSAGSVQGARAAGTRDYLGIPYAQAPAGALRWAPPSPARPWQGVRRATTAGPACAQAPGPFSKPSASEDCLDLNVITPTPGSGGSPWPVMVWLHGGGFTSGAGSDFDARRMVSQGHVIVVTVNYRLGVFGFFADPALGRDAGEFGLEDQLLALRWVQRNASAFGGDPHDVTLFGESAGGMSTCALLTSPAMTGLAERAIVQSGSCSDYFPENSEVPGTPELHGYSPLATVQALSVQTARQLGCATADELACLRRIPVQTLLAGGYMQAFAFPAYNTTLLPRNPASALRAGQTPKIPIMVGDTRDELRLFVSAAIDNNILYTGAYDRNLMSAAFGSEAARVESTYPIGAGSTYAPALAWAAATTDAGFICPTTNDEQALAAHGDPVYGYLFADENAPPITGPLTITGFPYGASHGSELSYLFNTPPATSAQQNLSTDMIRYWTDFARTGDPNGPGLPAWKPFGENGTVQQLAPGKSGIGPIDPASAHHCALWRTAIG